MSDSDGFGRNSRNCSETSHKTHGKRPSKAASETRATVRIKLLFRLQGKGKMD